MKKITVKDINNAREKAERTGVNRYHGRHYAHRSKSWATKFVDDVFQTFLPKELFKLSRENKSFIRNFLADGWLYKKYWDKLRDLDIPPYKVKGNVYF